MIIKPKIRYIQKGQGFFKDVITGEIIKAPIKSLIRAVINNTRALGLQQINQLQNLPSSDDLGKDIVKNISAGIDNVTQQVKPNAEVYLDNVIDQIPRDITNPKPPGEVKTPTDTSLSNLLAGSGASRRKKGKGLVPHGKGLVPHGVSRQQGSGVAFI